MAKKKRTGAGRSALAIRHVAFEDLGSFAPVLRKLGIGLSYREAGLDDLRGVDALAPDLLVVLGGPIGAYEEDVYPFLRDELRLIEQRLAADRPVLGICLGAQLLARALGARVYPGPRKEIGWGPLTLTAEGAKSPLRHLAPDKTRVLHWHGDTFDLPEDALRLASSEICVNQAFAFGKGALALQFHAEAQAPNIERWLIGHTGEISATPGLSVAGLRAETKREAPRLETQGPECFEAWLDLAGLGRRPLDAARPRTHMPRKTKKNNPKKYKAKISKAKKRATQKRKAKKR